VALVERRRRNPADDMVTALVQAEDRGDRLDDDDLITMIVNMIVGGHDTSSCMLAIGMSLFATHPAQQLLLRSSPTSTVQAAEEVLRAESPTAWVGRVPLTDVEIAGVTLRGGDYVLVSALAANHDPAVFPDPEAFDITRTGERMLSFGYGPHYCLGASLARVEAQEVFATVMARCHDIALLEPPEWIPFLKVRHIRRLPARFRPG
jgi:cytochrome P450